MTEPLDAVAVRVLGSLIEKEITTPDSYPLTLNALTAACNQTSNRDPVMHLDEATVQKCVNELDNRLLVRVLHRSESRVKRYRQALSETMHLHQAETAVMCVLMLRGPQTTGEIRTRTVRMFEFVDLSHVEITLKALIDLTPPLVAELPRRAGQKETRFAHVLSGEPAAEPVERTAAPVTVPARQDRIAVLEETVANLRREIDDLRGRLDEFTRQFQ